MYRLQMRFYVFQTPDGNYHVQNMVGGYEGQHHVHSPQSFDKWSKEIAGLGNIEMLDPASCDCGLVPGDIRGHTGKIQHNAEFE